MTDLFQSAGNVQSSVSMLLGLYHHHPDLNQYRWLAKQRSVAENCVKHVALLVQVIVAWLLLLAGAGLTAWGVTRGIYTQAAFAALAVAPILYAMLRVSRARFRAKCEMVRRAYENERCGRQDPRFTRLDEEDRTAIVAHHIVLAYLEEVLETCIYGERTLLVDSSAAMDRIAAGHTASLHRHGNNNNNNEREGPANPVALDAGPDRGTAAELAPAQSLMSAARGLRGSTGRGGMDTMGSDDPWCCCQVRSEQCFLA